MIDVLHDPNIIVAGLVFSWNLTPTQQTIVKRVFESDDIRGRLYSTPADFVDAYRDALTLDEQIEFIRP